MMTIMLILTFIGAMILFMPETSRALLVAAGMIIRASVRHPLSKAHGLRRDGYG